MYQDIYFFNVEQAVKNGQFVRLIDKTHGTVTLVNAMSVEGFYKLLSKVSTDNTNHYVFYVRSEDKDDAD